MQTQFDIPKPGSQEERLEQAHTHIARLLLAIESICTEYSVSKEDMENGLESELQVIAEATAHVDPKPTRTDLWICNRNGVPQHAFRCGQNARNYVKRMNDTNTTYTLFTTFVVLDPDSHLLIADMETGTWYFEAYDDDATYERPLLIVPIQ